MFPSSRRSHGWISYLALLAFGCGGAVAGGVSSGAESRIEVDIVDLDTPEAVGRGADDEARVREAVASRRDGEHAPMPPVARSGQPDPDAWPRVTVANDTPYGLMVWMSGDCARSLALPPRARFTVELCEGEYDLAAQIVGASFLPLVGERDTFENGSSYTFTFFVRADRTRRRVRRRR